MKSNEERRSKLSQICTMKTAYHQSIKRRQKRKKDKQTSKLKSFRKISQRIIQFTPNVNKQRQRS